MMVPEDLLTLVAELQRRIAELTSTNGDEGNRFLLRPHACPEGRSHLCGGIIAADVHGQSQTSDECRHG